MIQATVTLDEIDHLATETTPVTFGRDPDCLIRLDPDDTGVSRIAGAVSWENGVWWLVNRSTSRSLIVTDDRIPRNLLPALRRHPLDVVTRVRIDGNKDRQYVLTVTPHTAPADVSQSEPRGLPTLSGSDARISVKDREALAALFENYLDNPSRIENIRSYEAAAARIGQTPHQVRRRVENLRQRLFEAGVQGVKGPGAMQHLAEHVITSGLLTMDDVRRLPPRP